VPLLFENDLEDNFEKIIVLMRKRESRLKAIADRDACDVSCAEQKIQAQFPYEKAFEEGWFQKDKYILIFNDGTIENMQTQLDVILKEI
ncbi:MAG: dephospho-CoA kinase, partial [Clostridia bacterium]|nr:dephospho-CoA kinase [Clostridia bacterium]